MYCQSLLRATYTPYYKEREMYSAWLQEVFITLVNVSCIWVPTFLYVKATLNLSLVYNTPFSLGNSYHTPKVSVQLLQKFVVLAYQVGQFYYRFGSTLVIKIPLLIIRRITLLCAQAERRISSHSVCDSNVTIAQSENIDEDKEIYPQCQLLCFESISLRNYLIRLLYLRTISLF